MTILKEPLTDGKGSYYPWLCLVVATFTVVAGLGLPLYFLSWSTEHEMTAGQFLDMFHPSSELTRAVDSVQFKTALIISIAAAMPMCFESILDCAYSMIYEEERLLWYSKSLLLMAVMIPNLVLLLGNFGAFSDDAYLLATACTRVSVAGFTMAYTSQVFIKHHMKDLSRQCLQVATLGSASYLIRSYSNFANPTFLPALVYFSTALRFVAHVQFANVIRHWYQRAHSSKEPLSCCEIVVVVKVIVTFLANGLYSIVALYYKASNDRDASSECICMYMYIQIIYIMFVMTIPGRISRLEVSFLSRAIKERQAFIRYISHEIRTPLNTVFLGLEYVTSALKEIPSRKWDNSVEPVIDTVDDIYSSCEIALSILDDLLTFDKMEGGKMTLDLEYVNCYTFISTLLKPFNVNARNKNILLQLKYSNVSADFKKSAHVNIDGCKMGQVVRNLISNALKFTPEGGAVTVTVSHIQTNHSSDPHQNLSVSDSINAANKIIKLRDVLRVEVQDTGAGISLFNQTKLFGQYVQFNANKLQKGSGSGLGLWISKGITELHGGSIGGHSEGEEKGSTFYLELPVTFLINDDEEPAASSSGSCSVSVSAPSTCSVSVSAPSTPSIDHIRRTRSDTTCMHRYTHEFKGLVPRRDRDRETGSAIAKMTAESLTEGAMSHIKKAGENDPTSTYSSASPGLFKTGLRVPSGGDSMLEAGFPFLPDTADEWRGSSDAQSAGGDEAFSIEKGETDDLLGEARNVQSLRREISLLTGTSPMSSRSSQKTESASASASASASLFGLSEMLTRSIRGGIPDLSTSRKDSPDFLSSAHPFMVTSVPFIHSISSSRNSSSKYQSRFTSMSNSPRLGNSGSSTPVSTGLSTPHLNSPHSSPRGSGTITEPWIRNSASFPRSLSRHDNLSSICERDSSVEADSAFSEVLMRSSSSSLRPEKGERDRERERERSARRNHHQIPECCLEELLADSPDRSPALPRLSHTPSMSQRDFFGTKGELTPSHGPSNTVTGGAGGGGMGSRSLSRKDSGKDLFGMVQPPTQPLHFLIVDDVLMNRRMVHRLLSTYNFEISEAKDGRDCLRMLDEVQARGGRVDVVLMDNSMPIMTGPEAARAMRAKGYTGVLIGVTGHAQPADIQEFKLCGADAVLAKPLKFEMLTNLVREILSSKERSKERSREPIPRKSP